ncbi:B12-binding domain-containing radical SAM protein [Candidatus Woesearchaeota archaeon]|nr:B12-binding domain-containing radical SAM protein [Candidatus Woesearchaeota archaeon]MBW3022445.1 B12-binding domain-containing radical SAM protein [Candidatus Woesearchaeota archaeon]
MKVLLINAGGKAFIENLDAREAAPPLGLLYVASSIIQAGHETRFIDQAGSKISDEKIVRFASAFNPDLIGFAVIAAQSINAGRLSRKLKQVLPNSKIVWGGVNPTFNDLRIFNKYSDVDFCLKGEGEESILELLKAIKTKKYNTVHGLSYRINNKIKQSLPRKLIENIDKLPFPDRRLVKNIEYGSISGFKLKKFTSFLSSRGCPFTCKYCCCTALVNRHWRPRSVNNVLDELEFIQNQGYKNLVFFDDGLNIDTKRAIEIAKGIRKRRIHLNWFFEGRVDSARKEMLREFVKAGAKGAYFGAESANQRILDLYDKRISPGQTVKAVNNARKAGLDLVVASFILGCPTETRKEVENTIRFITQLDIDFAQVSRLIAYPGTAIWNDMVAKGYIDPDKHWEFGAYVGNVHPDSLPDEYLKAKVEEAYSRLLKNPKFVRKHVWRLLKSRFKITTLIQNIGRFKDKNKIKDLIKEK